MYKNLFCTPIVESKCLEMVFTNGKKNCKSISGPFRMQRVETSVFWKLWTDVVKTLKFLKQFIIDKTVKLSKAMIVTVMNAILAIGQRSVYSVV